MSELNGFEADERDESDDEAQFSSAWVPDPVRLPLVASVIGADDVDADDDAPDDVNDVNDVNKEESPIVAAPPIATAAPPVKARLNMVASVESDKAIYVCDKCKVCLEFVGHGTVCRGCGCELIHHLANESDDDSSNAFEYDSDGGHAGVDVDDNDNNDDEDDADDDLDDANDRN
jgi:hypothetical protein